MQAILGLHTLVLQNFYVILGCLFSDDKVAFSHAMNDAMIESFHSTRPGIRGMTDLLGNALWPYINLDLIAKAAECTAGNN